MPESLFRHQEAWDGKEERERKKAKRNLSLSSRRREDSFPVWSTMVSQEEHWETVLKEKRVQRRDSKTSFSPSCLLQEENMCVHQVVHWKWCIEKSVPPSSTSLHFSLRPVESIGKKGRDPDAVFREKKESLRRRKLRPENLRMQSSLPPVYALWRCVRHCVTHIVWKNRFRRDSITGSRKDERKEEEEEDGNKFSGRKRGSSAGTHD